MQNLIFNDKISDESSLTKYLQLLLYIIITNRFYIYNLLLLFLSVKFWIYIQKIILDLIINWNK